LRLRISTSWTCAAISAFLAWNASTSIASRMRCWRLASAGAAGGAMSSSSSAASRLSLLFWSFLTGQREFLDPRAEPLEVECALSTRRH